MSMKDDADHLLPLIRDLRFAVSDSLEKNLNKYDEMDVYRALTFTIISFATRSLSEEEREGVQQQYASIAQSMVEAGLKTAEDSGAFLTSIICGAAQTVNTFVDIIESAAQQAEKE